MGGLGYKLPLNTLATGHEPEWFDSYRRELLQIWQYLSLLNQNALGFQAIDIRTFATKGNGTSSRPWTGWDTPPTAKGWFGNVPYYAPAGFYQAASSPAGWVTPGFTLYGDGYDKTFFTFTNAGDGFAILNGTYATNMKLDIHDFAVIGTASTTNAFHFKNCHRSSYRRLKVINGCTAAGMLIEGDVGGEIAEFSCEDTDGGFSAATPVNGLKLDQSAANQYVTTKTIVNPRIAGVSGSGILGVSAFIIDIVGGYSERNNRGVETQATNTTRWRIFIDTESNTTDGLLINGVSHTITGGQSLDPLHFGGNAVTCSVLGGGHDTITVDAGAIQTFIAAGSYNLAGGTFTDNGTNTVYLPGVRNQGGGARNDVQYLQSGADVTAVNGANQNFTLGPGDIHMVTGPTLAFSFGGFQPIPGPGMSRMKIIWNNTAQVMTFNHEDAGSTAGFRINTTTAANQAAKVGLLVYSQSKTRWMLVAWL